MMIFEADIFRQSIGVNTGRKHSDLAPKSSYHNKPPMRRHFVLKFINEGRRIFATRARYAYY